MTRKIKAGVEPVMDLSPAEFETKISNGKFWGIPAKYFEYTPHGVKIKSALAANLEWIMWEEKNGIATISATTQWVNVNGEKYGINPGFAPCTIDSDLLV